MTNTQLPMAFFGSCGPYSSTSPLSLPCLMAAGAQVGPVQMRHTMRFCAPFMALCLEVLWGKCDGRNGAPVPDSSYLWLACLYLAGWLLACAQHEKKCWMHLALLARKKPSR